MINFRWVALLALASTLIVLSAAVVGAERRPIKVYTTTDGLPRNGISCIVRDSHGFLWFCTREGLSRFDGYVFTNYGIDQGLPDRDVTDLIETRSGEYWVATHNGIARFNPNALGSESKFVTYATIWNPDARHVMALVEDRDGTIWGGTAGGLCQLQKVDGQWQLRAVNLDSPEGGTRQPSIETLLQDSTGALWIGAFEGLYRRSPNGPVDKYASGSGLPKSGMRVRALLEDTDGRLWIGTNAGLFLLIHDPDPRKPVVARTFTTDQGLRSNWIESLHRSADGRILVGSASGLAELSDARTAEGRTLQVSSTVLPEIHAITEDVRGNLWMGTNYGAMRLARNGFTTYGADDGLGNDAVVAVVEDRDGQLCVINKEHDKLAIHRFNGTRFESTGFDVPSRIADMGWGWNQIGFQDQDGDWWLGTGQGLLRYPRVSRVEQLAHTPPLAIYTATSGLLADDVFRAYEDAHGDVWVGGTGGLTRWDRATGTFHPGLLTGAQARWGPTAFAEDRSGSLWIGFYWRGLARYRDGRFTFFTLADGLPDGSIFDLHVDHLGRLWIATTRGGLARLDDPRAERPVFVTFPRIEGVSNTDVRCITEDQWGRIYVGTGRGVYQIEPETGRSRLFTTADGLAGEPFVSFRDHSGALWFGSIEGLSRFVPEPALPESPAPIRVTRLRISGVSHPVSDLGETSLSGLILDPDQNDLQIEFASLNFGSGDLVRYQYRLGGADAPWSAPTDQRTVNFARLSSGTYRFQVRALNSDGTASSEPATIAFQVLAPVWGRWWFLALAGVLAGTAAYTLHHARVARLLELERVRGRIAADLHDDIGSNLSLIAVLSEIVAEEIHASDSRVNERLATMVNVSRRSVDAMSDIVWAINPGKDHLRDLTQRMRRFAADASSARNIEVSFISPSDSESVRLGAAPRRDVFLIFKEAMTNAVRHAQCSKIAIEANIDARALHVTLRDDGVGFDMTRLAAGHGLASMRRRAERLGGDFVVRSRPGAGTTLAVHVPLGRKWPRRLFPRSRHRPGDRDSAVG